MPDLLLPFLVVIIVVTITPGPDMLLVLRNGLRGGARLAWATGVGCCTGIAVHAFAATLGLSAILAASATAFTVVKLAGAGYLIWLGVTAVVATLGSRRGGHPLGDLVRAGQERTPATSLRRGAAFRQGLLSNLLNPKIAILFLSVLPQFVAPDEPRVPTTAVLAVTFVLVGLTFMRLFSLAVGTIARIVSRDWVGIWIQRVSGTLLAAIGVGVALDRR